jgi:hypothetical protein
MAPTARPELVGVARECSMQVWTVAEWYSIQSHPALGLHALTHNSTPTRASFTASPSERVRLGLPTVVSGPRNSQSHIINHKGDSYEDATFRRHHGEHHSPERGPAAHDRQRRSWHQGSPPHAHSELGPEPAERLAVYRLERLRRRGCDGQQYRAGVGAGARCHPPHLELCDRVLCQQVSRGHTRLATAVNRRAGEPD